MSIESLLQGPPKPDLTDYKSLYYELLYAVASKHPGQSRHQTALMYIQNAERGTGEVQAAQAKEQK